MKRIELTEQEIQVIRAQLNGEIGAFTATPEQQKILMGVIDKAEALLDELDAYDEMGEDMIKWYWEKYQSQNVSA